MSEHIDLHTTKDMELIHPNELNFAFERLRNDHACLFQAIAELEKDAKRYYKLPESDILRLSALREQTQCLLMELDRHSEWEDSELFPLLTSYFRLPNRPEMVTSLWMLEKEHELADTYFRLFMEESEGGRGTGSHVQPNGPTRAAELLLQACRLVKEHLQLEEETVLPLEEELLTTSNLYTESGNRFE